MARSCIVQFSSAVRAVAARCKLPFALCLGLFLANIARTKGIAKEPKASVHDKGNKRNESTA